MRVDIANKKCFADIIFHMFPDFELPEITGLSIDSRNIKPGDIFLPLKGNNFNGHQFIPEAESKGASIALIEDTIDTSLPTYRVGPTKTFLYDIIYKYRQKLNYPFIGITGSNGKTTTKELLSHVLSSKLEVVCTKGNYNSTTGAPLSVLDFNENADIGIVEIGANKPGEIEIICKIIKPEMGIITNIGEAHLSNFGSINEIAKTKSALFTSLPPHGIAFINLDDPLISTMNVSCSRIEYSLNTTADYQGEWNDTTKILNLNGILIRLKSYPKTMSINSLAVYSIASELGCSTESIIDQIQSFQIPNGRGDIIKVGNYTIINDCYNANFDSAKLGINNLSAIPWSGRKITIMGDMLELGSKEKIYHKQLGYHLIKNKVDAVFAYGNLSKYIIKAMDGSNIFHKFYSDKNLLVDHLKEYLNEGDIIYIKGSRNMKMEDIIKGLEY